MAAAARVRAQALERQPARRAAATAPPPRPVRQRDERVQAGGDAVHAAPGPAERGDEPVAAPAVGEARAAHVPVVARRALMSSASVSWSSAPRCRSAPALAATTASTRCAGSTSQPSRSAGRERLARRAGVDDVLGGERLHRADRLAVVAELAVVVVLDQQRRRCARPTAPPARGGPGRARTPSGNWWAGVSSTASVVAEARSTAPVRVDRQRVHRRRPAAATIRAVQRLAVGLDAAIVRTAGVQRRASSASAWVKPAQTTMRSGVDAHAARAGQVAGERRAQLRAAARVAVAERVDGRGVQRAARRRAATRRAGTRRDPGARPAGRSAAPAARGRRRRRPRPPRLPAPVRRPGCPSPAGRSSQPSATSWPYASATVLRAIPRSRGQRARRTAAACPAAAARSGPPRAARRSSAGPPPLPAELEVQVESGSGPSYLRMELDLSAGPFVAYVGSP